MSMSKNEFGSIPCEFCSNTIENPSHWQRYCCLDCKDKAIAEKKRQAWINGGQKKNKGAKSTSSFNGLGRGIR